MNKEYYILSSGRIKRKDNTIYMDKGSQKRPIPVNGVESIYLFGEVDLNSKIINFLSQKKILLHFFNYYGYYTGSLYPREYLKSGNTIIKQVEHYTNYHKRLFISKEILNGAFHNILVVLKYYQSRNKQVDEIINYIHGEKEEILNANEIHRLLGIEGSVRDKYYQSFDLILREGFEFEKRTKRPPENMLNAMISFGNSLLYNTVLSQIYHTQLNPTIGYLHEPSDRRFSLNLDIAEVFKPIIIDKIIFNMINNRLIKDTHFTIKDGFCHLNEYGKRIFLEEYDQKLRTLIYHSHLKRNVSYKTLIRLECYNLLNHIKGEKKYISFKSWL